MNSTPPSTIAATRQKTVALVGHCGPDGSYLRMAVSSAVRGTHVVMIDDEKELEAMLSNGGLDLVLFNRQLDYGFSDELGCDLIRKLRARFANVHMMLVSNYPDAQSDAIAAGALPGFGKREIGQPRVAELLRAALA